jgi:transcriptional regulator with XRE-family HTH domain
MRGYSPTPEEIRAARKALGLSQSAAAALIFSTLRTWQDWEAGKAHMHPQLWESFKLKASSTTAKLRDAKASKVDSLTV